jgi:hypothetical protein
MAANCYRVLKAGLPGNMRPPPLGLLLLSLTTAACETHGAFPSSPSRIALSSAETRDSIRPVLVAGAQPTTTYDDLLLAVSALVPGFGGLYPSTSGTVVWLLDPAADREAAVAAIAIVARVAERVHEASFVAHSRAPLVFSRAQYTIEQLSAWKQRLYDRGIPRGTAFSGISKRMNRLGVVVGDDESRAEWLAHARAAGVPSEALAIEIGDNPPPVAALQEKVRPIVGGIALGSPNGCTLGTGVRYRLDPGATHFLAASHCSKQMWALDAIGFHDWTQPSEPDTISVLEVADPAPFTGGSCPAGRVCRYTDATVVRLSNATDWAFATVARASSPAPFPITATYALTEQPFVLWEWPTVYKTGRTTGTTTNPDLTGSQTDYCYDWHWANSDRTVLCQIRYPPGFTANPGDSGSPVFGQYGSWLGRARRTWSG